MSGALGSPLSGNVAFACSRQICWFASLEVCLTAAGLFSRHNGRTDGYFPWQRGFDQAYTTDLYYYKDNIANYNGQRLPTQGWATQKIADWTIDFMKKNKDQPFIAYVPFMTPHLGKLYGDYDEKWLAPQNYTDAYRQMGFSDAFSGLYGMIEYMDYQVSYKICLGFLCHQSLPPLLPYIQEHVSIAFFTTVKCHFCPLN